MKHRYLRVLPLGVLVLFGCGGGGGGGGGGGSGSGGGSTPAATPPSASLTLSKATAQPYETLTGTVSNQKAGKTYSLEFNIGPGIAYRSPIQPSSNGEFSFVAPAGIFSSSDYVADGNVIVKLMESTGSSAVSVGERSLGIAYVRPATFANFRTGDATKLLYTAQLFLLLDASSKLSRLDATGAQVFSRREELGNIKYLTQFLTTMVQQINSYQSAGTAILVPLSSPSPVPHFMNVSALTQLDRSAERLLSQILNTQSQAMLQVAGLKVAGLSSSIVAKSSFVGGATVQALGDAADIDLTTFARDFTDSIRDRLPKIGGAAGAAIAIAGLVVGGEVAVAGVAIGAVAWGVFTFVPAAITASIDGFAAVTARGKATFDDLSPTITYVAEQYLGLAVGAMIGKVGDSICGEPCEVLGEVAYDVLDILPDSVPLVNSSFLSGL